MDMELVRWCLAHPRHEFQAWLDLGGASITREEIDHLYRHSLNRGQAGAQQGQEEDVVERSAGAVDDHAYQSHEVSKWQKKQSWDEWMASSARVLADAKR